MFGKRLQQKDVSELRKREELINQHRLIIQGLEILRMVFVKKLVERYKLNPKKNYSFDLKTGKIKVKKPSEQISCPPLN